MLNAIKTLDGRNLTGVGIDSMAGWVQYVFDVCCQNQHEPSLFLNNMSHLWGRSPEKKQLIYLDRQPISVHDILEYLGVVVEMAYHTQSSGEESKFPDDLSASIYLKILHATKYYLPKAFNYSNFTMAQEIEGILDLSLWIPIWPNIDIQELPEHAIDLIPSYRVGFILDACKDLDLPFSFDKEKDVNEIAPNVKKFQEAICDHLNWKTPSFIANKWYSALGEVEKSNYWNRYFFHHPKSPRLAWTRQLINEFGNDPGSASILAGSRHYGKINFPTIYNSNSERPEYIPNSEVDWPAENRHFQKIDVLLFAASRAVVNGNEWNWMPKTTRSEAEETWKRLIASQPF